VLPRREKIAVRRDEDGGRRKGRVSERRGVAQALPRPLPGKANSKTRRRCAYPSDRLSRPPCYPGTGAAVLRRARGRWRRCSSASSCSARPASMNPVSQPVRRRVSFLGKKGRKGQGALQRESLREKRLGDCIYRTANFQNRCFSSVVVHWTFELDNILDRIYA